MPLVENFSLKVGGIITLLESGRYLSKLMEKKIFLNIYDMDSANNANGFSDFFDIFIDQFGYRDKHQLAGLKHFATLILSLILTGKMKVKCAECNTTYERNMVCGCKIPTKRGINEPLIWDEPTIYREALRLLVNGCKSYIIIPDQDWNGTLL